MPRWKRRMRCGLEILQKPPMEYVNQHKQVQFRSQIDDFKSLAIDRRHQRRRTRCTAVMSWSSGNSSAPGFHRASRRGGLGRAVTGSISGGHNGVQATGVLRLRANGRGVWQKALRWISWSRLNPGRRYYARVDAMVSFPSSSRTQLLCSFLLPSLSCSFCICVE